MQTRQVIYICITHSLCLFRLMQSIINVNMTEYESGKEVVGILPNQHGFYQTKAAKTDCHR